MGFSGMWAIVIQLLLKTVEFSIVPGPAGDGLPHRSVDTALSVDLWFVGCLDGARGRCLAGGGGCLLCAGLENTPTHRQFRPSAHARRPMGHTRILQVALL